MYAADYSNPWVQDVLDVRRRWRASACALVAVCFSMAVLFGFRTWGDGLVAAMAAVFGRLPGSWPDTLTFGALQCLIFGLFLIFAVAATRVERRRLWRRQAGAPTALAAGLAIGAGGFCAAVALAALAGAVTAGPPPAAPAAFVPMLFGLAVVALQSVAEETFFRGWLQPLLCADWGVRLGLPITSALFGGLHVIAGAHGPLAVMNLFLGGLLFGLLALRSGGLWAPAAAHFAWNWAEAGGLGLAENPSGSLVNLKLVGDPLWNGGADTMNGSLATTVVLLVMVAAAMLWKSKATPA